MIVEIYIENDQIDLFKDENIEVNSSVANVEDISKVNTDYTFTFTVPATDTNNRIFKHYYNADIDNTFDARTKKDCRIEMGGLPFRTGKMRLEKVTVKSGKASSYTINFWGNLVSFKTLLKDDELSSLDLTAYDHLNTYPNVLNGLTNGLFNKDIIYTLISQKRQYMYTSLASDNTNTDKLVNIAYNGQNRGVQWNELKPSIRVMAIIRAIEAKYGINFSRDFFGRSEFNELYLWLNNSDDTLYTRQAIDWVSGNATDFGLNLATNIWTIQQYTNYSNMRFIVYITPQAGYEDVPYRVVAISNDVVYWKTDATGTFTSELLQAPNTPFNVQFFIESAATFQYDARLLIRGTNTFGGTLDRAADANVNTIVDTFDVGNALPKMKILEFLKGFFNMFKMVAIPDSLNNVYVNTIDEYYRYGNIYDITPCVDWASYDVERGKLFNNLNFKYQDPTTILNMEFKKRYGYAYGDKPVQLNDDEGVPLDGDSLDIVLPFEQVLYERLTDLKIRLSTNVQYGLITNESISPANPKGVIHYNNSVSLATSPISLLDATGHSNQLNGLINTPAHTLGFDNPAYSILWTKEASTWNGIENENTLFKNYWASYISSIYNIKKRNFKFKVILPIWLLTKLNLNDVLFIKDRYYRINDFVVNLRTGAASLNLMNTFENNFNLFAPVQSRVFLNHVAQTYGVYVSNGSVMNFSKTDTGYGTDWATITQSGNNIMITVTEYAGTDARDLYINVDNGAGKSFQVYLNQDIT